MRAVPLFTSLTIAACSPVSPTTRSAPARFHGGVTTISTNRIADAGVAPIVERAADPLVGRPAPRVHGVAHDGSDIDTDNLKGRFVVLYFYPKDETPGCTKQACSFRDAWKDLSKDGAVMIGISADSDESHKKFVARATPS